MDKDLILDKVTSNYATYEREFRLKELEKKEDFTNDLEQICDHQKIPDRLEKLNSEMMQQGPTPELVEKYQKLDYEFVCAIRAAGNKVCRKDFGYQSSDELIKAGRLVRLHRSILSCHLNNIGFYPPAVVYLAEELEYDLPFYDYVTISQARKNITGAIKAKREIHKEDGEYRAKSLERRAEAIEMRTARRF